MDQPSQLRTILQIEDNAANAALVEQLIARRDDLRLLTASDGYQGIEMVRVHQPDVVLMDIRMPGLDGHGALKLLRKDPATASIPVIALSSKAFQTEIKHSLEEGFFRYITKPYIIDELMAIIDAALLHAEKSRPVKN